MDIDKLTEYWLAQKLHPRENGLKLIRACFGSERELFLASRDEIEARVKKYRHRGGLFFSNSAIQKMLDISNKKNIIRDYEHYKNAGIRMYVRGGAGFPSKLKSIPDPPERIFVRGDLPDESLIAIGIVGARNCTPYGRDMAQMFSYRLAKAGVVIISGMARGIDGWSHRGAIEAGGLTVAVLGCGVEVCYPRGNAKIFREIPEHGALLSEYPTDWQPLAINFPMRNRIISGLSDGILVVEARERSGSLITADAALDQGKDVFVIPGRIGDELSVGCNRLIRQGAIPVLSPSDILEYYGMSSDDVKREVPSGKEKQIYDLIGSVPVSITQLADASGLSLADTLGAVARLKEGRHIRETSGNRFMKM